MRKCESHEHACIDHMHSQIRCILTGRLIVAAHVLGRLMTQNNKVHNKPNCLNVRNKLWFDIQMRIRTVLDSVECTHCSITRLCHFSATKQTKQQPPDVILAPVPNRAPCHTLP